MMTQCPVCGSSEIVSDLKLYTNETVRNGMPIYAKLVEPEPAKKPFTWMVDERKVNFYAAVCGECGYTQLYTKEHAEILEAHQKGFQSRP